MRPRHAALVGRSARAIRLLRRVGLVALIWVTTVSAQPRSGPWGQSEIPYDGRFTFVRLRWQGGTYGTRVRGGGPNSWLHEFPGAEGNFMNVLADATHINARTDGSLILTLDDPDLFDHPIAMMWEPGFWAMTDTQAERLREYLLKGGFVIFNDFEQDQWANFAAQLTRVLPGAQPVRLDGTHPVFQSFLPIQRIDFPHPPNHHLFGFKPEYFGVFEDNDPTKRLLAIVNYNTNLAEYWQLAGTGLMPLDASTNGFTLGVSYMLYGMTH